MDGMQSGLCRRIGTALIATLVLGWGPAGAQDMTREEAEEEQRCVWSCLANSPGADSPAYQSCVETICLAPKPSLPRASSVPAAVWKSGVSTGNQAYYAGVEISGKSFSFHCTRGGEALLAIDGMGSRTDIGLRIDDLRYGLEFTARNGVLFTPATPHLITQLLAGNVVEVARPGEAVAFPLTGSGKAIRRALAECGMRN